MQTEATRNSKRPIRSYVIRSGRLTRSQRKALDDYWGLYVLEFQNELFQLDSAFEQDNKLIVEIGFGMGDSLLEMAGDNPQQNYLGIDVHKPGIGKILQGIADRDLRNIKLVCHDAREVLSVCLQDDSVQQVQIFFPDPWPKKRHHKRRLIQSEFVALLVNKLEVGGAIHLATDWQAYAEHMMVVLQSNSQLLNCEGEHCYWSNPVRPETKFENRGRELGHGVWDLLFAKRN
ncbi:MAG: tRNA (guanosine(46)-N7)-methyltransferase TrmB [Gammaproteobacteria bacterium]|nr:tRNA (guanosine(46)-N7)-methyltransferase TrmB [Gammaproteobacteria bacterium]HJO10893.1 tRNA (guanosine(46)-N7)-methyltransferase TrmB [Gammaproteobacteria bacterium]